MKGLYQFDDHSKSSTNQRNLCSVREDNDLFQGTKCNGWRARGGTLRCALPKCRSHSRKHNECLFSDRPHRKFEVARVREEDTDLTPCGHTYTFKSVRAQATPMWNKWRFRCHRVDRIPILDWAVLYERDLWDESMPGASQVTFKVWSKSAFRFAFLTVPVSPPLDSSLLDPGSPGVSFEKAIHYLRAVRLSATVTSASKDRRRRLHM